MSLAGPAHDSPHDAPSPGEPPSEEHSDPPQAPPSPRIWPALTLCFAYRWAAGVLLALPLSAAAKSVVGLHPRADAVLWEPGAFWLAETVRLAAPKLSASSSLATITGLLLILCWLWPAGALVHSLGRYPSRPTLLQSLTATTAQLPRLVFLYGLTVLLSVLCLAVGAGLGRAAATSDALGRAASLATPLGLLAALPFLLLLRVAQDALRIVALQQQPPTFYDWMERGVLLLSSASWRDFLGASWREALALLSLLASGAAAWQLTLQGESALMLAPLHATGLALWLLLRTDWLRWLSRRART